MPEISVAPAALYRMSGPGSRSARSYGKVAGVPTSKGAEQHMEDLRSLAESAGALLKERGETVAVVESSAGGLVSAALLAAPGASAYFVGGAVVYTRTAQRGLLRVPDEAMEGLRASTEEYALLNARTARELLGTTWGLAETGASGPTGNRYGDSPGHSCVAVSGPVEASITLETGSADREGNMWTFARTALDLLERCARDA